MAKKKVLKQKQKQKQKQTQKQSVIINLAKPATKRKPSDKPGQSAKSMQPIIVQATQPVFPTPMYDFLRLENKIADLAKLGMSKPVEPVIAELKPVAEMKPNVDKIREKIREGRLQYPSYYAEPVYYAEAVKKEPAERPLESEMPTATEVEDIPVRRPRRSSYVSRGDLAEMYMGLTGEPAPTNLKRTELKDIVDNMRKSAGTKKP